MQNPYFRFPFSGLKTNVEIAINISESLQGTWFDGLEILWFGWVSCFLSGGYI